MGMSSSSCWFDAGWLDFLPLPGVEEGREEETRVGVLIA